MQEGAPFSRRRGATTDQGGAGEMREPGEVTRLRVPGGAEGVRGLYGANRSTKEAFSALSVKLI